VEVTFNNGEKTEIPGTKTEEKSGSSWATGVGIDGVIGNDKVEIDNNGDARVGVGTNGDVTVHNNGNVCGNIRHGVGKKVEFGNNGTQCNGYKVTEGNVTLPPVSSFIPSDIATNNSNFRLVKCTKTSPVKEPKGCQSDTYSVNNKKEPWTTTVPWNASTRTISTENNATLTLGGGDYFVCKLTLANNSHLIMAAGATVRVFFDTPENCKMSNGATQIEISNNADITSTGYQPSLKQFNMPGFYLLGSTKISTKVEFSNNTGTNEFVLYAPNTEINLSNNAVYVGIIAGKTVHLSNNAIVKQDSGFILPTELNPWKETTTTGTTGEPAATAQYYSPQSYVECSGVATAGLAPNADC
ncbi:MAG TPA: hypothetical protein VFJ64_01895, partial [Solirubrobacterales bacterium]|nr:hypothetical protein [Solirubrobacterales bacterium]